MISTSTPVGRSLSAWAAICVSFIATLTAVLMLGAQTIGILLGGFADVLVLVGVEAGRGDHQRLLELDAVLGDGDGGVGHREVDHDVGVRFADDAQRHADLADAGDQSGVLAQGRMIGRLERGDDFEARVLAGDGGDALAHAAGGSVDGDFHGSKSFGSAADAKHGDTRSPG